MWFLLLGKLKIVLSRVFILHDTFNKVALAVHEIQLQTEN